MNFEYIYISIRAIQVDIKMSLIIITKSLYFERRLVLLYGLSYKYINFYVKHSFMYTCITFYSNTNSLTAILKLASITVYFREKKKLG